MTTPSQSLLVQPKFDPRIFTMAFPLTGSTSGIIQRGYMIWDSATAPTQYGGSLATVHYLYNPSTVSSDYNIASASAQAAMDFPNPGDSAALAIPLSQTAQWSLMFDRTFELWGQYGSGGTPNNVFGTSNDPSSVGVQADVMQFMQFTGMYISSQYTTNGQGGLTASASYSTNQTGIMQMIPCWAYFGASNIQNNLMYYGYINEWSVQYTHWTQYNIPMRCVISVNFTMLPWPSTQPSQNSSASQWSVLPTPTGNAGITNVTNPGQTLVLPTTGVSGR
jgi:hypothetical protein